MKHWSKETKEKIARSMKNKWADEEYRKEMIEKQIQAGLRKRERIV